MELEILRKDMVAAMKAKDKPRKEAISSVISAVKKVAIDEGCRDELSGAGGPCDFKGIKDCEGTD